MRKQITYIADDGTEFNTKQECLDYEKENIIDRKLREIRYERQNQISIRDNALDWMQMYKSGANMKPKYTEPTIGNVLDCQSNLSRIEAIYVNAKKQFFKDLNTPGLTLKARAHRLYQSAHVLEMAIEKRQETIDSWYKFKQELEDAQRKIVDLYNEEAELIGENKNE